MRSKKLDRLERQRIREAIHVERGNYGIGSLVRMGGRGAKRG